MSKLTRKAIIGAFMDLLQKKSLDKITVKDIIESAEVNRNTFYYHFADIYDLLDNAFMDESSRFRSEYDPESSFNQEAVRLADFLQSRREGIMHIYNSNSRDVLTRYLEHAAGHFVEQFVRRHAEGTSLTEEGIEYITCFYTYAIMGVTLNWVEHGMPDYQDGLVGNISDSFEATVDKMIQVYISAHPEP